MYSHYAIMYRNLRKSGLGIESTYYYAESEEEALKKLRSDLHRINRGYSIEILAVVKVDD